jgi:hypothetical protein
VSISLSKTCFIFVWKIVRTPLPVVDKDNYLSKPNFYLSVLQMKSSSTCLITASLCEGPFFYFYVESPPSTFMHYLREHSCYSEYNVHCPKVFIDWLIIMVSLVLKLFISSRPLKTWRCPMHLCFAIPWGISWKPFVMFFHMIWTHVWLLLFYYSWSFICVSFHVITWLLSFYCQDYVSYAHVLSSLIPALNALLRWSRLWWCMSPQKIILLLSLTYSRTSRS